MTQTGTSSQSHHRKTLGRLARLAGVVTTCACMLLPAGCDRQSSPASPTAPGMSSSGPTHIRGLVTDTVRRPLGGALVAVLDGPLAGTTKLTDEAGRYELTGTAAGRVTLGVSRDGFHPITRALSWQRSTIPVTLDGFFSLDTLEPPIGLEPGDYTLTIAIDLATAEGHKGIPQAPCAGFPAELASRSYRVTIQQGASGIYNRFVRADDRPLHSQDLFEFSIAGRFVGFEMDHGIPEDFPEFRFLNIGGGAPTTEPAIDNGSSISIPWHGEFRYCQLKSARGIYNDCSQIPAEQIVDYHSCSSDQATMVFTKR